MFDALSERLERVGAGLRGRGRLSDADLDEALAEVRVALLEADVELSVARAFLDAVRERVAGAALSASLAPGQQVIKAVHEQLVEVLGGESLRVTYASRPPTVILLAGLQGAGKTTAAAKLARWFKQQGRQPYLVAADLQRPAAVEQLQACSAPRSGSRSSPASATRSRWPRRGRRGPARRARRRHRRHRGPPGHRRGADGRGRARSAEATDAALHLPRHRRGHRPGRRAHRAAASTRRSRSPGSSSPSSTTTRAAARCSRRAGSSGAPVVFASTGERLERLRPLPPRPDGVADPGDGRRADASSSRPSATMDAGVVAESAGRHDERDVHPRRLPRPSWARSARWGRSAGSCA